MGLKSSIAILATGCLCALVTPAAAATPYGMPAIAGLAAQSYLSVIEIMESNGYRVVSMKSTLLGRVKIRAKNREHVREVVVSRSTGEVMSDRIVQVFGKSDGSTRAERNSRGSGDQSSGAGGSGVSASVGGTSVSAGSGGVSASTGSTSASAGSGGVSASTGGGSVSVGLGG